MDSRWFPFFTNHILNRLFSNTLILVTLMLGGYCLTLGCPECGKPFYIIQYIYLEENYIFGPHGSEKMLRMWKKALRGTVEQFSRFSEKR